MTSSLATQRILLVDDHAAIHDDLRKILQPPDASAEKARRALLDFLGDAPAQLASPSGFEFADATQGEEAVELAREAHRQGRAFDLAIVDMRMPPGIDGLETAARLRELQPELPVLFCTAFSDHSDAEMIRRLGAGRVDIARKPLDPRKVRGVIERLMNA